MLNCAKVAEKLNISINTLRNMREAGILPPHSCPTPGRFQWREEDIKLFSECWPRTIAEYDRRKEACNA